VVLAGTRVLARATVVAGLVASGTVAVASGVGAAPPPTAPVPATANGKPHIGHLSTLLSRVVPPAVAAGSARTQAAATGTPSTGPGSLRRDGASRLLVDIRVERTDAGTVSGLTAAGAKVKFVSAANHNVTASVRPADLVRVGNVEGVQYVSQIYTPITARQSRPAGRTSAGPTAADLTCNPIVSEGDTMLNAAIARSRFGVDGTGVPVGLLSDSFGQLTAAPTASDDVTSGDLPGATNPCGHTTPVNVLDDTATGGEDEGRAMAQTVHDLAPGSDLSFATAFNGENAFANNIRALATTGAKVIADDVTYPDEPMYQDGVVSNAVSAVTAAGVSYYSSAANNNLVVGGKNVGSYEATGGYRPTTCPTMSGADELLLDCHNFRTSGGADNTYGMTVQRGGFVQLDLQWAQPLFGVSTDLDLMLLNSTGLIIARSEDDNLASQDPFEFLQWDNTTASAQAVRLVVGRFAGTAKPRFKFVHLENGATGISSVEYSDSVGGDIIGPTIFGHNGAATAGSVAAVPFNDANTPEYYSSHGPVTLLFGPVNGSTPAPPLASPQVLAKPDFAATDCVQNTFFGFLDGATWRFCGTSDAAPHAAAVAALLLQRQPSLTPAQVLSSLATSAAPVANGSPVSTGAGRLDANPDWRTTVTVSGSAAFTQPGQSVTFNATVTGQNATPTGTVTFDDGDATLSSVPVDSGGHASLAISNLPAGSHHIRATYSGDLTNDPSMSATTADVVIDGTAPAVTLTAPVNLFQVTNVLTVSYSATDALSGVADYDIRYRSAVWNGAFTSYNTSLQHQTVRSKSLGGSPGHEYCFSVRARDRSGNTSAWTADRCTVVPLDDRSLKSVAGTWSRTTTTSTAAYLGTLTRTTTVGSRLQLAGAHVDRIVLVVTECSTCGNVGIYLNGVLWRTVGTHTSASHYRVIVVLPAFSLRITTIELRDALTGRQVVIDGLGIART
jgi:hypothetical protein